MNRARPCLSCANKQGVLSLEFRTAAPLLRSNSVRWGRAEPINLCLPRKREPQSVHAGQEKIPPMRNRDSLIAARKLRNGNKLLSRWLVKRWANRLPS